jgi:flagellar L-ring protein precursor FlgH
MRKLIAPVMVALLAGACAADLSEVGREPRMTPVGAGLATSGDVLPAAMFSSRGRGSGPQSLWDGARPDLFRDPRASRVGDVVTVAISMNDRATLGNSSDRSRDSKISAGFDFALAAGRTNAKANGSGNLGTGTSSKGEGSIDRSEKINLAVAAVVTDVLPNGNLVISGTQEVRVNYELRLLQVAGMVRPRDISRDNTISYDKIAEARISYGGRGRLSEVQQPGWGHQLYDIAAPF